MPEITILAAPLPRISFYPFNGLAKAPFLLTGNDGVFPILFLFEGEKHWMDVRIPAGTGTDGASCPRFSPVAPIKFLLPALLHDYGYRHRLPHATEGGQHSRLGVIRDGKKTTDISKEAAAFLFTDKGNRLFFDMVLRFQCEHEVTTLNRFEARMVYWAVRLFGARHFLDITTKALNDGQRKVAMKGMTLENGFLR